MLKALKLLIIFVLAGFTASLANAQKIEQDTLLSKDLQPVTISATRTPTTDLNVPIAVSTLGKARFQNGQLQLTLNEALSGVPGLTLFNAENFAQDTRIAVRGFGARSAFGIRGVKLLVDGLPESTPDGQAQVDNLDIGLLESAEIVRGPSAGLYGNAAGGVISLFTEEPADSMRIFLRLAGGSFAYRKLQAGISGRAGNFKYLINTAHWRTDGFRNLSKAEQTTITTKIHWQLNAKNRLTILANHANSPYAFDPGALTRLELDIDRRAASGRNIQYQAGESVNQQRLGLIWRFQITEKQNLTARLYGLQREFVNALTFTDGGLVSLKRATAGGGMLYTWNTRLAGKPYTLQAGFDIDRQADERQRRDNLNGLRGDLAFNQRESFGSMGMFVLQQWNPTDRLNAGINLRFDKVWIEALDRFLFDGNDSDKRSYHSFNPMAGLSYALNNRWRVYANVSSSFETPALSELSANPLGAGGFNPNLESQSAWNMEIGSKGIINGRWKWDMAIFWIESRKELAPFELELFPGRSFYRNTGQTQRKGLELGLDVRLGRGWSAGASYTYSDFVYQAYTTPDGNFEGNQLPGLPKHQAHAELRYLSLKQRWWAGLQSRYMGSLFVNDANTLADKAYVLLNLKAGYHLHKPKWSLSPYLGVNNLLNTAYNGNVRINAALERYFEPASGINVFGGLAFVF